MNQSHSLWSWDPSVPEIHVAESYLKFYLFFLLLFLDYYFMLLVWSSVEVE